MRCEDYERQINHVREESSLGLLEGLNFTGRAKVCQDGLIFELGTSQVQVTQITTEISITWK
jgi:hypothetical protein